jgi:hypothetical protein
MNPCRHLRPPEGTTPSTCGGIDACTRLEFVCDPDKVVFVAASANETIADALQRCVAYLEADSLDVRLRFRRHKKMSARRLAFDQAETPELNQAPTTARVRLVGVSRLERRLEQVAALHAATTESVDDKRKLDELERAHLVVQSTCMDQHVETMARIRRAQRNIARTTATLKEEQRKLATTIGTRTTYLLHHPRLVASCRQAVSDAAAEDTSSEKRREALESAFVRQSKCAVCWEPGAGDDVLQPCGHAMVCPTCAAKLVGGPCPVCRTHVSKVQRVYRS